MTINNQTHLLTLEFYKRSFLSHLMNISQLIKQPETFINDGNLDLDKEYNNTASIIENIDTLIKSKTHED